MTPLRSLALVALLAAAPTLVQAQSVPDVPDERDGSEMMSEGAKKFFEGLSREMAPLADAWRDMLDELDDLNNYEKPERLPNGDIIIRRKTPLPVEPEGTPL